MDGNEKGLRRKIEFAGNLSSSLFFPFLSSHQQTITPSRQLPPLSSLYLYYLQPRFLLSLFPSLSSHQHTVTPHRHLSDTLSLSMYVCQKKEYHLYHHSGFLPLFFPPLIVSSTNHHSVSLISKPSLPIFCELY